VRDVDPSFQARPGRRWCADSGGVLHGLVESEPDSGVPSRARSCLSQRKAIGYVQRHLAQRPRGDVENTPWRYSLMNWVTTR
jgi:hypothetical protein